MRQVLQNRSASRWCETCRHPVSSPEYWSATRSRRSARAPSAPARTGHGHCFASTRAAGAVKQTVEMRCETASRTRVTRPEQARWEGRPLQSAGVVVEVGARVRDSDRRSVAAPAPVTQPSELVGVPANLCAKVPNDVPLSAAALTTVAAIGLHGIAFERRGRREAAVIGCGLVDSSRALLRLPAQSVRARHRSAARSGRRCRWR